MTRSEILDRFRTENPEITDRVITDSQLHSFALIGDKEICAITRCIVDQDGTTISTTEDDQYYDLTAYITNFYDIDEYPGGGVTYDDKRIEKTTIAALDEDYPTWRNRSSGTPRKYYRRGQWMYLDRPIDSDAEDIKVYSVLISDDFDQDSITPYNQLTYLEPFHYGIVKYLQFKSKEKIGKRDDALKARQEYMEYTQWMKKMITGGKISAIRFEPKI